MLNGASRSIHLLLYQDLKYAPLLPPFLHIHSLIHSLTHSLAHSFTPQNGRFVGTHQARCRGEDLQGRVLRVSGHTQGAIREEIQSPGFGQEALESEDQPGGPLHVSLLETGSPRPRGLPRGPGKKTFTWKTWGRAWS